MSDDTDIQSFVNLVNATPNPQPAAGAVVATPAEKPTSGPGSGKRHMTRQQRVECTVGWRLGTMSVKELAKKYGVTERALYKYFGDRKIKFGELANKQVEALEQVATVDPKIHAQRVFETKDETYRLLTAVRRMIQKELVDAQKNSKPVGSCINELRALREAAAGVKVCREEIYAVLGIKEGEPGGEDLPELRIRGLTEEEVVQLQQDTPDELEGTLEELPGSIEAVDSDDEDIVDDDDEGAPSAS